MKTRDWLLAELIKAHIALANEQNARLRNELESARENVVFLTERVHQLSPQKQYRIVESSLVGSSAERTIQMVSSSNGVTTITL
jgi:hypothetical protein